MEKIIKLNVDGDKIVFTEDFISSIKSFLSGCRVNFLLGAGFSANLLGVLNNKEIIFQALDKYQPVSDDDKKKVTILKAYLYWSFFNSCIAPIADKASPYKTDFKPYIIFGDNLYRIFSERSNPALDRQFNIFTTNYDPIIEVAFDRSNCICNDGFEGRIIPRFSTDNYSKSFYRQAMFSNRKSEIPSLNLLKLHGSLTWKKDIIGGGLIYQDFKKSIKELNSEYETLFDNSMLKNIDAHFTANSDDEAKRQISSIIPTCFFDSSISNIDKYEKFICDYKNSILIVNPTKEKFSDTLLNKNYYELLRIFSNELEKENSLLVVNGFSFRDEHILDLVKRSMINPSLKVIIFCYEEKSITEYQRLLEQPKNNNITYVALENEKLSLDYFNQILSEIHV